VELVIITGMSGAGRRSAAHVMEDLGWYVVDNLPPALLPALAGYLDNHYVDKVAVVLDVRSRGDLEQIPVLFESIAPLVGSIQILYVEASDSQIVKRQESVHRPVPLQGTGGLLDGIHAERAMMSALRASADMVIDTSGLTGPELSRRIVAAFGSPSAGLSITLQSFGFKNGIPLDADMVLDVRFLPNPHWVDELRPQTGLSAAVSSFVLGSPLAKNFVDELETLFAVVVEGLVTEGKRLFTLAIGCTGGKHRSVAIAEEFALRLRASGRTVTLIHRDLGRE